LGLGLSEFFLHVSQFVLGLGLICSVCLLERVKSHQLGQLLDSVPRVVESVLDLVLMLLCLLEGSVSEFLLDGLEFGLGCLEEFLGSADLALDVLNGSISAAHICGSLGDTGGNVGQPSLGILGFDC
jgi:hypothetical protein